MSLKTGGKSIAKNTFFKFSLSVFNVIVPTIVTPYVNWMLGREQVNLYTTATTLLQFFMIFATFGVYNYGIREINRVRDDKKALSQLFTNLFLFGVITSLLTTGVYLFYMLFSVEKNAQAVFAVMVAQIIANLFMVEWMNEALENYGFIAMKTMIIRVVSTVLLFLVVRRPQDVMLYAGLMSLTVLVNNIASFWYVKRRVPFDFSGVRLGRYWKPLFIMLLITNVDYLYTQLDRIFLIGLGGDANTNYTLPSNLINMLLIVVQSLLVASIPRLSYYQSHGQEREYEALLHKSSRSYFLLLFPVCIGLLCLAYETMYFYGSPKFVEGSAPVLAIFALRSLFSGASVVYTTQILYLKNREKALVAILAAGGVLNLIFDIGFLAAGWFTPVSAIATTLVAEAVKLGLLCWYTRRRMHVGFGLLAFCNLKYLYFSLPFFPIVWGIKLLHLGVLWTSLIAVPVCALLYGGVLLLTRDDMLLEFIGRARSRFVHKP